MRSGFSEVRPAPVSGLGERQLRLLLGLPFVAVGIAHSESRRWLRLNDRLCELTGYRREELERLTWPDLCVAGDRAACFARLARLLSGETSELQVAHRILRKDGTTVNAEVNVRLGFPRGGGTPLLIVLFLPEARPAAADPGQRAAHTAA